MGVSLNIRAFETNMQCNLMHSTKEKFRKF